MMQRNRILITPLCVAGQLTTNSCLNMGEMSPVDVTVYV